MATDPCILCGEDMSSSTQVQIRSKGLATLLSASIEREDGLSDALESKVVPFFLHEKCRKDYTRRSSVASFKRKREEEKEEESCPSSKGKTLRSTTHPFNVKEDCLFCSKPIDEKSNTKKCAAKRNDTSEVSTIPYLSNVIKKADERNDKWGMEVKMRIQPAHDLVAEEGKYHRKCAQLFYLDSNIEKDLNVTRSNNSRPTQKARAFEKLCHYLENNRECQYSSEEITSMYNDLLSGEEGYGFQHLKNKLEHYFGDNLILTGKQGKEFIFSFRDASHRILRQKWESDKTQHDKSSIIDMAASIIRDEIRTAVYNCSEYPNITNLNESDANVPESLLRLLQCVIKGSVDAPSSTDRKITAIAHSIISACRPRSYISPILLSIATYLHRKYASREVIDILSGLSFSCSYKEIQRLNNSFLDGSEPSYELSGFTQYIFDNADFNVATLTGHNTFHTMGGIA